MNRSEKQLKFFTAHSYSTIVQLLYMALSIQGKLRQSKIKSFWKWFRKNKDAFLHVGSEAPGELIELQNRLRGISKYAIYELTLSENDQNEHVLTISADGVIDGFQDVIDIVSAAPEIRGWQIRAFRQKRDVTDMKISVCEADLTIDKIAFTYFFDQDKNSDWMNLNIYLSDIQELQPEIQQAVFLFLDATIGEFNVGTKIGRIGIGTINEYEAHEIESKLMPLEKLARIVEEKCKK